MPMRKPTQRARQGAAALAVLALAATAGCGGGQRPAQPPAHRDAQHSPASGAASARHPFTLVATGDVLPHDSTIERAKSDAQDGGYDFRPMLAGVKPIISRADLAICHMETVYGPDEGPFTGYPAFTSPPQVAAALKDAGYDSCSTASNHTLDDGADGIARTLKAFDKAGLSHTGSGRTAQESARPALMTARGAKVAQLAYTYDTNGYPMPDGQPWAVHLIDQKKIVADARAARAAGADVVVVSLHWGTEWQTEPDERQLALGKALTASRTGGRPDIDLILGTHAHIPQAYEKVNGVWIVYGEGDQVAGEMFNDTGERDARGNMSSIARFTFAPPVRPGARWEVSRAEFVPQWIDVERGRVMSLPEAVAASPEREEYAEALDHIRTAVLSRGAAKDGLKMSR
ncbi:Capsule biosynthesis protein CapA [Streptomyces hundungensis]|uniref:Capsule biosynthesis protein CapA n=2 Tax=Streptomyces hundungensis TaxID=1077946 RepID=A0A387H782_9ACTN|nr:CapA family protein [Streptomyces hundungensis]AYG79199.1 Capsule biosynthesis protein CapA [Streptomyces hundungensis]